MIIYKITNLINGKIYIGKDTHNDPNYFGSGKIILQSINKYGKENFIKETIDTADTIQELDNKEIKWIKELNSQDRHVGYNISNGGNGGDTFTNNPDKEKIRKEYSEKRMGHKGIKHSEETKRKLSEMFKGRKLKDSQKEKIIKSIKERSSDDNYRKKLSESMTGKKKSEEHKKNISLSKMGDKNPMKIEENKSKLKGIKRSEESKEKNRQSHLGKKLSDETKEKIRKSMLEYKKSK